MTQCLQPLDRNGELLPKIRRFCEYYVSGKVGNVAQCLVKAGYSTSTAKNSAKSILEVPEVKDYINELESKIQIDVIAEKEDVLMFWSRVMGDDDCKTSDRINASKLLAEYLGLMDKGNQTKDEPIIIFDMGPPQISAPDGDTSKTKTPVVEIVND